MTGFLASVANPDEMEAVRIGGADIVDLKDPAKGALGAWDTAALEAAVARWRGWGPEAPALSATIGDQPMRPEIVVAAAERVAATGVPLVKLGVRADGALACLDALRRLAQRTRLIAVFFADLGVDLALVDAAADAGFAGVMVDTADKAAGGLRRHMDDAALAAFVATARGRHLLTGLAGSLALADVAPLARLAPDYLGFRGALCDGGRTGRLDAEAVARVRAALKGRRAAA
ncbi:(5-formylfuran-3-yl)methyl phosphate synthase [Methylopila sp. 73B]|uniref:(5-formylfuran-3-yl)methyl phosphate synthase n=1 Tax=Methylopila sp. 73B TaxID=1120792 RepID=UPI000368FF08|nr:(5-formylfuran-3-yl)methyl phosphate synthase [Methylopila sp. 73B]